MRERAGFLETAGIGLGSLSLSQASGGSPAMVTGKVCAECEQMGKNRPLVISGGEGGGREVGRRGSPLGLNSTSSLSTRVTWA